MALNLLNKERANNVPKSKKDRWPFWFFFTRRKKRTPEKAGKCRSKPTRS